MRLGGASGAIGVTIQQYLRYETGNARISCGKLYTIARTFGVPISAFFRDTSIENYADESDTEMRSLFRDDLCLDLLRAYEAIPSRFQRRKVLDIVRAAARIKATER
ncbi:hypothetical protein SAMN05192565_11189 [Methylobacterium gossipiicola]|uniref:HTH cro/C1-type domain-containing protein n=1 Tax=Methylobacterium gossipiicola TaxID=582675 RepID=A0A1I2UQH0_9HYPH|nr:hypothetical protein SAMN05192565_11189 [Methylobacterium gossipiicola]